MCERQKPKLAFPLGTVRYPTSPNQKTTYIYSFLVCLFACRNSCWHILSFLVSSHGFLHEFIMEIRKTDMVAFKQFQYDLSHCCQNLWRNDAIFYSEFAIEQICIFYQLILLSTTMIFFLKKDSPVIVGDANTCLTSIDEPWL